MNIEGLLLFKFLNFFENGDYKMFKIYVAILAVGIVIAAILLDPAKRM